MRSLAISTLLILVATSSILAQQDEEAQAYLDTYSSQLEALYYRSSLASWAYYTNLTSENQKVMVSSGLHVTRIILFSQTKHMMRALKRPVSMSIQNICLNYNNNFTLKNVQLVTGPMYEGHLESS